MDDPPLPFTSSADSVSSRQSADFRPAPTLAAAKAVSLALIAEHPDTISAYVDLAIACFEGGAWRLCEGPGIPGTGARDLGALDERLFYYAGVMGPGAGPHGLRLCPNTKNFSRRHPDDLETRLRLANLFYRMEELDKSIEAYRLVLVGQPNDPLVSYNLAMAFRGTKKIGRRGWRLSNLFWRRENRFPRGINFWAICIRGRGMRNAQ